jgi:antibiotic biosynthesis monooxygenase (ABM) superfamily enzyme
VADRRLALQVGLMTYVVMPRLTRLLAKFIYAATRTT